MRGFHLYQDLRALLESDGAVAGGELASAVELAKGHRFGQLVPVLEKLAGEVEDPQAGARLKILQGFALRIVGEWDRAQAVLQEVGTDAAGTVAPYDRARAMMGVAEIRSYRGEYEDALRLLDQATAPALESDSKGLQALNLCLQAGIYSRTGDQHRARALLEEAEAMLDAQEDSAYVRAQLHVGFGLNAFREGQLAAAEESMHRALSLLPEDSVPIERGDVLRYLGVVKGARGQQADSLASHQAALRLFRETGYTYGQARTYNSIGRTFLQLTRLEEAIFYMEKGVRVCRDLRADAELATVYGKIGNAYMLCEDYGRAIHYLLRDLELSNRFKNYYALGYTHRNLGRCYTMGGNLEEGIQHLNESLGLFQFVEDSANTGRVYLDLCQANAERGKLQEARTVGGKALHLLTSHNLKSEAAYSRIVLGGVERRLGNLEASAEHLAEAMNELEKRGTSSRLAEGYYELGQLAADKGDRQLAFAHLERALSIAKELGLKKHATRCFAVMESIGDLELLQLLTRDVAAAQAAPVPSRVEVSS